MDLRVNGMIKEDSAVMLSGMPGQVTGVVIATLTAGTTVALGVSGQSVTLNGNTNAFLTLLRVA